jgi:hypothetical protein
MLFHKRIQIKTYWKRLLATKEENLSTNSSSDNRNNRIDEIRDKINKYSDYSDEVKGTIKYAAESIYGGDIIKLRRFLDIFRFYYFIYVLRLPEIKDGFFIQLRDWIILSIEWPTIVEWIENKPNVRNMEQRLKQQRIVCAEGCVY